MIRFEKVFKGYKDQYVLEDINIEFEAGKLVVLLGSSGCGKTTLLRLINRLEKPNSGNIYIHDKSIYEQDVIRLRRNMGYVVQSIGLFPHLTIRENLELLPRIEKMNPARIEKNSQDLMQMVGLDPEEYMDRYPKQLSGGQKQRVGVARAFALNPEIILMDEPFSAVDPITRAQLQSELIAIQAQKSKTIIFVTHDVDEAMYIADKICVMGETRILQYDTPQMVREHPASEFVSDFINAKDVGKREALA